MGQITSRPDVVAYVENIVSNNIYDKYAVDYMTASPQTLFTGLSNFCAAHVHCYAQNFVGAAVYEVLYQYMVYHNVIITQAGVNALHGMILRRCSRLGRRTQLLCAADGFLVRY